MLWIYVLTKLENVTFLIKNKCIRITLYINGITRQIYTQSILCTTYKRINPIKLDSKTHFYFLEHFIVRIMLGIILCKLIHIL